MVNEQVRLLRLAEGPWTLTFSASPEDAYSLAWKLQEACCIARIVRGSRMTNLDDFYAEIGAALQLPSYFGENWPALHECLTDLSWLRGPSYVLIFTDADLLFRDDEFDSLPTLLKLASAAGEEWAAPTDQDEPWGHGSVPFHFVFQVRKKALARWRRRLAACGGQAPAIDFDLPG